MRILVNTDVRRLFVVVLLTLLLAGLSGQILVQRAAADLKNTLVAHDAALAGALVEAGMDPAAVAAAFTVPKSEVQAENGAQVLAREGLTESLDYRFLPEAVAFARHYHLAALVLTLVFSAGLLVVLYGFAARQDRRTEQACRAIEGFMRLGEESGARLALEDAVEGSQAQFFSAINSMGFADCPPAKRAARTRVSQRDHFGHLAPVDDALAPCKCYRNHPRRNTASPVIDDFVQKSQRELSRMEMLIQNLLKLARLDAGAIVLEKRGLRLKEFLESTLERFSVRAEVEGKALRLVCPGGLALEADENWLAEAAGNLIKNALDHTTTGGQVEVICEETSLVVSVTVKDNGSGIHPDDLPHVFKRFYRSRFSQDHQGVGIGLTLARSIVEKHGGSMTVESEPGQGAAFRMVFPKLRICKTAATNL
jgi:signal transduction histidine kinase